MAEQGGTTAQHKKAGHSTSTTTKQKRGHEFYEEIGKKGGESNSAHPEASGTHHEAAGYHEAAAHHHRAAAAAHATGDHETAKKHAIAAQDHSSEAHSHTTAAHSHSHTGVQGGTHEQHVAAGQQSHKNAHKDA